MSNWKNIENTETNAKDYIYSKSSFLPVASNNLNAYLEKLAEEELKFYIELLM